VNHSKRNRKSIRLQYYDYGQPGFYFITICTNKRRCLFGEVNSDTMILNHFGKIAHQNWLHTENLRDNVKLGAFVVMPNHMHAIFQIINCANNVVGAYCNTTLPRRFKSPSNSVGAIVRGYKSTVTRQINEIAKEPGHKIWQRNYYEHIIRNQESLNRITEYININPKLWEKNTYFQ
jgi:REP element-mobilizing transposase RayT